jgi:hypothetical protein
LLNGIFGANSGSTAAGELKKIFDATMLGGEKMEKFGKMLRNTFEYIGQGGFNELFKDLKTSIGNFATDIGDKIGKSFSAAVDNYFKGTAIGGMISKSSSPATANGLASNQTEKDNESVPQLLKVVDILQKIYREGGALFS